MSKDISDDEKNAKRRQDHNRSLLDRMNTGEPLWAFDSKSSWFPPRPKIEKDSKAIEVLYGAGVSGQKSFESKEKSGPGEQLKSVKKSGKRPTRRDASANSPTAD